MQREISCLKKASERIPILLVMVLMFSVVLAGCSKGPLTCDRKDVQKAVIDQHLQELRSQLSAVAAAGGQSGMELTEDEWRLMRAGMNFELRNIRQFSYDEAAGVLECEADLIVFSGGMQNNVPIEYTAEIVAGTGQIHATIYELE